MKITVEMEYDYNPAESCRINAVFGLYKLIDYCTDLAIDSDFDLPLEIWMANRENKKIGVIKILLKGASLNDHADRHDDLAIHQSR